jgi:hypothetical protein
MDEPRPWPKMLRGEGFLMADAPTHRRSISARFELDARSIPNLSTSATLTALH